ncbi:MAG TPA: O-antigen ligase family protein [Candidatus Sulfotelmatobacter sp.]|nr:O-antigen ligase family protein [Candidatus Sulfotelmatobacter sp.]
MASAAGIRGLPGARLVSPIYAGVFAASLAAGAALFWFDGNPRALLLAVGGVLALIVLLAFPELALAVYVVIGDVKGDDRVASLVPVDLTLVLAVILIFGIALNFLRGKRIVAMPAIYFLLLALALLMTVSLAYTPVFEAGLEKLGRFLTVTAIAIVAPFFVLGTPRAMQRFLFGFAIAAYAICAYSLTELGGEARLATPSNNTIGLGHIACALIVLIWFAVVPRFSFPQRIFTYLLLIVPGVALIGSGSRGPAIALAAVLFVSLFFYRRLLLDLAFVVAAGILALPFIHVPASSLDYLATLAGSRSTAALLSFRGELLEHGWKLLQQHPLLGAGIQGFRFYSPNAGVYNWPHNIFLEIACEIGIPAAMLALLLFGGALRESLRQLEDRDSPHHVLAQLAAALLLVGIVNAVNTGDINSDRSTWLFVSLVFVAGGLRSRARSECALHAESNRPVPA